MPSISMRKHFLMRLPKMTKKWSFLASSSLSVLPKMFLGALFLCLAGNSVNGANSVPDWLAAAGRVDLNHFGDGSVAVAVGEWTDFEVDATGKFVMTERRALRVLNRRSADQFLNAIGKENNDTKVTSIETWAISPSGRVTQSGKKDL